MNFRKSFGIIGMILGLFISVSAYAQHAGNRLPDQADLVRKCDTLWYYGIDLSHLKVTDASKIDRGGQYCLVYPAAWVGYVEKELPPYTLVQPELKKETFYYVPDEIQQHTLQLSPGFIIAANYSFPLDTVYKAVKSYKLSRNSGLGLVIICENFNKNFESSSSWVTFFDIKTREVMWTVKVTGKCSHMGYTAHWGSGVVGGFHNFISSVY